MVGSSGVELISNADVVRLNLIDSLSAGFVRSGKGAFRERKLITEGAESPA